MKKLLIMAFLSLMTFNASSCSKNKESAIPNAGENEVSVDKRKILAVYFSWGGTTKRVAEEIVSLTKADIFRIEPVTPYPTEYTPCTEVAKVEVDEGIRPNLKSVVKDLDQYDTIFVGCPVWWHTAPMVIWSFLESQNYNFKGKTIIPFCTYAATYRDETLAKIVALTPESMHLTGFGSRGSSSGVKNWLQQIKIIE